MRPCARTSGAAAAWAATRRHNRAHWNVLERSIRPCFPGVIRGCPCQTQPPRQGMASSSAASARTPLPQAGTQPAAKLPKRSGAPQSQRRAHVGAAEAARTKGRSVAGCCRTRCCPPRRPSRPPSETRSVPSAGSPADVCAAPVPPQPHARVCTAAAPFVEKYLSKRLDKDKFIALVNAADAIGRQASAAAAAAAAA
jgi:hypothetical protein